MSFFFYVRVHDTVESLNFVCADFFKNVNNV